MRGVQLGAGQRNIGDAETAKMARAQKARDRKARMLAMEAERKQKGLERKTELQKQQAAANADVLVGAQRLLDENHDDVKKMNSMMLYAKCVAIRDRQIEEKEELERLRLEEDRRIELQMEAKRVESISEQEKRVHVRELERKEGARMIRKQMAELEQRRKRGKEEKYQEGQRMLKRIAELDAADRRKEQVRAEKGRELIAEVARANEDASIAKAEAIEAQRLEDEKIARYIADKQAREAAYEAEVEKMREAKEKQQNRMRNKQAAQAAGRADLDAIRARRALEAANRRWRQEQEAKAEAKRVMISDLTEARERQRQEKELQMAQQARQEREEFNRVIAGFREQEQEDARKAVQHRKGQKEYCAALTSQINDIEHRRQGGDILVEQKLLREKNEAERKKLENIKRIKLLQLEKAGVPKKYRAELAKFKPLGGH